MEKSDVQDHMNDQKGLIKQQQLDRKHIPFSSNIGEQLSELLYLNGDHAEIELGREEIRHFQEEEARERSGNKAVVYSIPQRRSGCISVSMSPLLQTDVSAEEMRTGR